MSRLIRYVQTSLLVCSILTACSVGLAYVVPLPDRLEKRDSVVVEWSNGEAAHVFLSQDDKFRIPVDLERVDPLYIEALLTLEDSRFWWQPGVDPFAIIRDAWSNLVAGRVVSGGSTITMQLVRLLEPRPRTLTSKIIEAFRAIQLEIRMSKKQILENYLTYVPYGRNIEGIGSASYMYFGKSSRHLSPSQVSTLLAVPQNPVNRYPSPENRERLRNARKKVGKEILENGGFSSVVDFQFENIQNSPVPDRIKKIPQQIPHMARWLRAREPDRMRLKSGLKPGLQQTIESIFENHELRLERKGIHNLSGVIIEHQTGAVRAAVGNVDFSDQRHGGQIPGFDVRRSTGSLLKPFIYAMAIDRGIAAPSHLVEDIPKSYNEYQPQNFGGQYRGLVELEKALSLSLNIPFVDLVKEIGVSSFLTKLKQLGVGSFEYPYHKYGLSMAVGGLSLTPLEVGRLYAGLAKGGRPVKTSVLRKKRASSDVKHVLSAESTWFARRALSKRDRPDFPNRTEATGISTNIHWKTGTSARNRDAWSVGSGPNYTAVVWAGNFDNSRSPQLVGAPIAGPILFEILEASESGSPGEVGGQPDGLIKDEVCAFSGHLAKPDCPRKKDVLLPKHSLPPEECPFHTVKMIDKSSGKALNPACRAGKDVKEKRFLQLPSAIQQFFDRRGGNLPAPPAIHPDCNGSSEHRVQIRSPSGDETIRLKPGVPKADQQIPLEVAASSGSMTVHWFVDGKLIETTEASATVWWTPSTGTHEISVMTSSGKQRRQELIVEAI